MTIRTFGIRMMMIVGFSAASFFVVAATGGKKTAAKITSSRKAVTYHNFSLRSGFEFKGSKILKVQPTATQVEFNSLALIKTDKGIYSVPYTHTVNVKNNQVKNYNTLEVKVVKINL